MEHIQVIAEKEMVSKLLKQFIIRIFVYSFLYFAVIVGLFIFGMAIQSDFWVILLVVAINVLFLMLLSRLATTDAFEGINTTSAPKKSLQRISNSASIPMFVFTCIFTFMDIIFFHSLFDTSSGYTSSVLWVFFGTIVVNVVIWALMANMYEKRILRKYLTLEEVSELQT